MTIHRSARFSALRTLGLVLATLALISFADAASAQSQDSFRLVPVSPTSQNVVLGDSATLEVRVLNANGGPAPGVQLTWEVVSAPGSPRGTSGAPSPSDAAGIARARFGFGVVGTVTIRASFRGSQPVLFSITVGSLGQLTSDNNTRSSAGGSLDDICFEVFNNADGSPRPNPRATPLCVFMTGVLTNQDQRTAALVELSPTGLGSASKTAAASTGQQQAIVASRLGALRGGAMAAGPQISWSAGGSVIDGRVLASARSETERRERLGGSVDAAFRTFAGRGARKGPAQAAAGGTAEAARERRWGLFFTGQLQQGKQSGDVGDETAFDFDTASGILGVDFAAGANAFFGIAGGYATNQTDLSGGGGKLEFDAESLTVYGAWQSTNGSYLQATLGYGSTDYDQRRRIDLPVLGALDARAMFGGDQQSASLEGGWDWGGKRVLASSFVRGSWAQSQVNAFAERGAIANVVIGGVPVPTDFGVAVEDQKLESLLGELGFVLSGNISTSRAVLVPQFTLTYRHEFDNDSRTVRASFLGDQTAGSSFFVFLDAPDRDWIDAGVSLSAQYLWGSLFAAYDREFGRDDFELATWQAGLRFEF
ncbi:MAG: autotransporter domain-containing protein [Thermoanaerobaculia bacterium]